MRHCAWILFGLLILAACQSEKDNSSDEDETQKKIQTETDSSVQLSNKIYNLKQASEEDPTTVGALVVGESDLEKNFPEVIYDFKNLESLILIGLHDDALPDQRFGDLKRLKSLAIKGKKLPYRYPWTQFPSFVKDFPKLKNLSLEFCADEQVDPMIYNLKSLRTLEFKNCAFKVLDENLGQLEELEQLKLLFTNVTAFPKTIGSLKNLKSLEMQQYFPGSMEPPKLTKIPEGFYELVNLEKLQIVGHLPSFKISGLGKLKKLNDIMLSPSTMTVNERQKLSALFPNAIKQIY